MNKEIGTIVKKTAKIAGVTCVALGGAALVASGAALKAMTEGAKYLKDTIEKIVDDDPKTDAAVQEASAEEVAEVPAAEAVAEEADFAQPEHQEAVAAEDHA